ncbi:hypothetical protein C8R46DRAFT_1082746 [Mycena filopes]|nr:hypothetical protein C8R46DRAFT_1082746 [Mycena filopes]
MGGACGVIVSMVIRAFTVSLPPGDLIIASSVMDVVAFKIGASMAGSTQPLRHNRQRLHPDRSTKATKLVSISSPPLQNLKPISSRAGATR